MELSDLLVGLRQPWMNDAACKGTGTELFFPEQNPPTELIVICNTQCSVRAECLQYALDNCEQFGIWGGRTVNQRRRLRAFSMPDSDSLRDCRSCGASFVPSRSGHVSCSRECALAWCAKERSERRRLARVA
jgi:hypothetical protein